MPTRPLLLALLLAALLAPAPPASAAVRLFTAAGAPAGTPVRDDAVRLRAWSADGTHLLVRREGRTVRVSRNGAVLGRARVLDRAYAIGPGERAVVAGDDPRRLELRAPDGTVTGQLARPLAWQDPAVAWSRDGTRLAVATGTDVVVADSATGAVLLRWRGTEPALPVQAFAPDGSALVVVDGARVVRLDVTTRAATALLPAAGQGLWVDAAWSPAGPVAIAEDDRIYVTGAADLASGAEGFTALGWSGDGTTLAYAIAIPPDTCSPPHFGVGLADPAIAPRVLVPPAAREVRALLWSPDGTTLAADLGPVAPPAPRRSAARRPPWPLVATIPRDFAMPTRAGDAAVRQVVVQGARLLRAGERREVALAQVRLGVARVADTYRGVADTAVRERIADELDRWLRAAGFPPIAAYDEVTCGA